MSIHKTILSNMILEREMLHAKRYATLQASLPFDGLDKRIALLEEQIVEEQIAGQKKIIDRGRVNHVR